MNVEPIGIFQCAQVYRYDAGRQGTVTHDSAGTVVLHPGRNFEQALSDLEGFSHVWLLFQFHKNENWKPLVRPPRGDRKVGVFASRTPYRPNPIGMSCVRLGTIDGLRIEVFDHDLLDGTPILDIKPYLPYADSVPDATTGWLEECAEDPYTIEMSEGMREQVDWLATQGVDRLEAFLIQQLSHEPCNTKKKRVRHVEDDRWEIAYRTWRVRFSLDDDAHITLRSVHSGYSAADLKNADDPHGDKAVHRAFLGRENPGQ